MFDQQLKVFQDRYAAPGETSPDQMFARVAKAIANNAEESEQFFDIMNSWKFIPGGRILAGAGTDKTVTYYNCFVIPVQSSDLSKGRDSRAAIMDTIHTMLEINSRGGGVGINWSTLRPRGASVKGVGGISSGAVSWMEAANGVAAQVEQGGSRRAALMFMLADWHPDIEEFIKAKKDLGKLEHANMSVCISDKFIDAVKHNEDWALQFPDTTDSHYNSEWEGNLQDWIAKGYPVITYKTMKAKELFDLITETAWQSGEPGVVFIDRANDMSNLKYYSPVIATNPCLGADTLIQTEHGYEKISELKSRIWDGQQYVEAKAWSKGLKETLLIHTAKGSTIVATPDHRFMLANGTWCQAKDLYNKDVMMVNGTDTVDFITLHGTEEVWDFTSPKTHKGIANGFVVHNCGEQPLEAYGVCNLGSINLVAFIHDGQFDTKDYQNTIRIAVRFLDNVIDKTKHFLPQNEAESLAVRRIGLGVMGLADALIMMGVKYGSKKAKEVTSKLMQILRDTAYQASVELAKEKGSFPAFDERYWQSPFITSLPTDLQADIEVYGIRNAVLLTQAPTGTTSILAGVSSGIEPNFAKEYIRTDRTGTYTVKHPLADNPAFVSAHEVTPEQHVEMQAIVQQYVDASVSKTVNLPNNSTVEDVRKIYMLAYDLGCKGITVYRDGSREGVLQTAKKGERPNDLQGITKRVETPIGRAYITVNYLDNKPFELFATLGKAGSDIEAFVEAIARLVSLSLRSGVAAQEICKQLVGIGGSTTIGFGHNRILSVPDAIGKALAEMLEIKDKPPIVDICPSCGAAALISTEGCKTCQNCGYSVC